MKKSTLKQIRSAQSEGRAVALVTFLDDHTQAVHYRDALASDNAEEMAVEQAFRRDRSQAVEIEGRPAFIRVYNLPLRLLIIGAVHIAQSLTLIAAQCGYTVIVIDPRRAFATNERFPDVELVWKWPDAALQELELNDRTAVVTLTHDPKLDEPALVGALQSNVFYIGALGSRRTHAERCKRLVEAGLPEDRLNRIHAPVGLNIAAKSQAEIAVSIMAEITQTLRTKGSA